MPEFTVLPGQRRVLARIFSHPPYLEQPARSARCANVHWSEFDLYPAPSPSFGIEEIASASAAMSALPCAVAMPERAIVWERGENFVEYLDPIRWGFGGLAPQAQGRQGPA